MRVGLLLVVAFFWCSQWVAAQLAGAFAGTQQNLELNLGPLQAAGYLHTLLTDGRTKAQQCVLPYFSPPRVAP